jgi:arsenate reductase-like glutaredoxin family protein
MEHQILVKEPLHDASSSLAAHDGHHAQSNAEAGSQAQNVLDWLRQNHVTVSQPADVRNYLTRHSDLAELVLPVCTTARARFENRAKLYLEVNRDPEIDDEYLALYIRQNSYQDDVLKVIREISREALYQELVGKKGWFTVTTDFKPEA